MNKAKSYYLISRPLIGWRTGNSSIGPISAFSTIPKRFPFCAQQPALATSLSTTSLSTTSLSTSLSATFKAVHFSSTASSINNDERQQPIMNERIPHENVLFIDEAGVNQGTRSVKEILASLADKSERYNLVLLRNDKKGPVARLLRQPPKNNEVEGKVGKEGSPSRRKEAHSKQAVMIKKKEVWIGTGIQDHDLSVRINMIKAFIFKGYRVQILINRKGVLRFDTTQLTAMYHKVMENLAPSAAPSPINDQNLMSEDCASDLGITDREAAGAGESKKSKSAKKRVPWSDVDWPGISLEAGPICDGKSITFTVMQRSKKAEAKRPSQSVPVEMRVSSEKLKEIEEQQREETDMDEKRQIFKSKKRFGKFDSKTST